MGDPFLDDTLPREYVLYLRPTGPLAQKLSEFWQQSKQICGKNKAHNIFPHITLCQFFMVKHSSSPVSPLAFPKQPLPGSAWRLPPGLGGGAGGILPMPGLLEEVIGFLSCCFQGRAAAEDRILILSSDP